MADEPTDKIPSPTLAELRALLAAEPRSLAEIARSMEPPMSVAQLSQFKSGLYRSPSFETAERVALALGRPIVLAGGDPAAPPKPPAPRADLSREVAALRADVEELKRRWESQP